MAADDQEMLHLPEGITPGLVPVRNDQLLCRRLDVPPVAEDGKPGFRRCHPITLEMNIGRFLVINASNRRDTKKTQCHRQAGGSADQASAQSPFP